MSSEFGKNQLKSSAYAFAGLAMMLNIRLVYSDAQYALLRFKLPENLFNIFLGNMGGGIKIWCIVSMVIANVLDIARKRFSGETRSNMDSLFTYQSIFWSWANFSIFVVLLIVFVIGGDQGNVTAFYWSIAASGFVFGINMVLVYAMEWQYLLWYMIGENSLPIIGSLLHYVGTLFFGKRTKCNFHYNIVVIDISISLIIALVAAVLWTCVYKRGVNDKDGFGAPDSNQKDCTDLKLKISVTQLSTEDANKLARQLSGQLSKKLTENPSIPKLVAMLNYEQVSNLGENHKRGCGGQTCGKYYAHFISPSLMVLVGMALLYVIYPSIAPGIIVPFDLIDKIEILLMIATPLPSIIIGILEQFEIKSYINKGNWGYKHEKETKSNTKFFTLSSATNLSITIKLTGISITSKGLLTINDTDVVGITIGIRPITASKGDICFAATHELDLLGKKYIGYALKYDTITLITLKIKDRTNGQFKSAILKPTSDNEYSITGGSSNCLTISSNYTTIASDTVNYDPDELHQDHKNANCCFNGKVWNLKDNASLWWNSFIILVPLKISIFAILICSLHYRESNLSRSIIDKPIMSIFLTITFYMCHKILLAVGYPGIATDEHVLLPIQLVAVVFMVFLEFYSVGYLDEYKKYDPDNWPTDGMKGWEAFCFWCKSASKNTNANLKALFTKDLRRDLEFLETKI